MAALLRIPFLSTIPPPLHQDEASRGYDAWAILETGADRHGQSWPLFLESFGLGDYTAALSTYLTIPFVAALGPTVMAMRLPSALLGVATVLAMYGLVRGWMGVRAGLVAAAILAIDPWHVFMTRTAHEAAFAPFFLVTALWAWQRAGFLPRPAGSGDGEAGKSVAMWAVAGGVLMGLHAWVYPATRLFTPLFLAAWAGLGYRHFFALWKEQAGRRAMIFAIVGLTLGAAPFWITALHHPERLAARAGATLIFARAQPLATMLEKFAVNVAKNLDPRYLFWQCEEMSGTLLPRVGQHLLVLLPLFVVGLVRATAGVRRSVWSRMIVAWVVLAVIPAAVCGDWNPHPFRTISGLAVFPILCAFGIERLGVFLARMTPRVHRAAMILAFAAFATNAAHFGRVYYGVFPKLAEFYYQTPLVKALEIAGRHEKEADFILVTNRSNQPYIYALLFQPVVPRELNKTPRVVVDSVNGFHQVLRVGKYYFAPHDLQGSVPNATTTFRGLFGALPPTAKGLVIENIGRFRDGEVLATVPCGDGSRPGDGLEIRWWRIGEGQTDSGPSVEKLPN